MKSRTGLTIMDLLLFLAAGAILVIFAMKFFGGGDDNDSANQSAESIQTKEDEELEKIRKERLIAQERERAQRDAERREQQKKYAEEEAMRQNALKEREQGKEKYCKAFRLFRKPFSFARSAPKDENPQTAGVDKTFWCVFPSFASDRSIFEITVGSGGIVQVNKLLQDGTTEIVDASAFTERLAKEKYMLTSGDKVWVEGVRLPGGKYEIPANNDDFSIMNASFGDLMPVAKLIGLQAPDFTYTVALRKKDARNEKDDKLVGTVTYSGVVRRRTIEEAASKWLSDRESAAIGRQKAVKKKQFKPTVVLYDGDMIKKDFNGVTYVPRRYNFVGTNKDTWKRYDREKAEYRFRAKWENLVSEARRQEQKMRDIEKEYEAAVAASKAEYERKKQSVAQKQWGSIDIEKELSTCNLIVTPKKK